MHVENAANRLAADVVGLILLTLVCFGFGNCSGNANVQGMKTTITKRRVACNAYYSYLCSDRPPKKKTGKKERLQTSFPTPTQSERRDRGGTTFQ